MHIKTILNVIKVHGKININCPFYYKFSLPPNECPFICIMDYYLICNKVLGIFRITWTDIIHKRFNIIGDKFIFKINKHKFECSATMMTRSHNDY